jgi:N-methylhydantoinase B/oxoprolinase/acetone carboxylase alpha subunit
VSIAAYEVGRPPGPPTRKRVEVDPITLRVLGGAFHAIAKEMAGVLFRMSYSSIIRESEDLGAGIFDAQGRELCESDSTPMHIGSLPWYIRGFLYRLGNEIEDGDVIVHNHPYLGASHSPDVAVAVPIFHDGELLGFAAVTAHVLDVGGSFPGINADAFDVYAEAKVYNALRWYRRGELNEDLDRMIFDNVRTETMNRGDLEAMLASCVLGRDRFLRLLQRYGVDVVMSSAYAWMDYSERMLRQEIARIPDGEYGPVVGWLDDDARNRGERLRVETRVVVEGDEITIDLTGSNPEVPTGYNVPFEGSLLVGAYYAVRTILLDEVTFPEHVPQNDGVFRPVKVIDAGDEITIDLTGSHPEVPTGYNVPFEGTLLVAAYFVVRTLLLDEATFGERVPQNDGIFRPVNVIAPKGTIFNPSFPRACFSRFCQVQRVIDNTILALSDALPEKTTAGNSAGIHFCSYSGFDEQAGQYWLYLEVNEGAYGGRFGKDALDSVDNLMVNTRNNPIEELDQRFPMRCERYELRPEPAAPGRWRGGIGIVRENRFLVPGTYSSEGDRHSDPPRGVFGGRDGVGARVTRNPGTAGEEELPAKVTGMPCEAGDVNRIQAPNAAGYGDPLDRDAALVREDVLDDFTTPELAREAYGVVLRDGPGLEIDAEATTALRDRLRADAAARS